MENPVTILIAALLWPRLTLAIMFFETDHWICGSIILLWSFRLDITTERIDK